MLRHLFLVFVLLWGVAVSAQDEKTIVVKIVNAAEKPLAQASVTLLRSDSSLVKISVTDTNGLVQFSSPNLPSCILQISLVGYAPVVRAIDGKETHQVVVMHVANSSLQTVVVTARKPFLEVKPDRTIVNLDASITSVGTTLLEALEKLPGVSVDRDGIISLKGRGGVKVMIDGKLTYLEGTELAGLLNGMNAADVTQVELMDNPPASLDAAGNAGVINIKTKKGTLKGFNGTLTVSPIQGIYPKSNENLLLNYRSGRVNLFLNYGFNQRKDFNRIYALRTYYRPDGSVRSLLEQPGVVKISQTANNLRTGLDYGFGKATTLSLTLSGFVRHNNNQGDNPAVWMKTPAQVDSVIQTKTGDERKIRNLTVGLGLTHRLKSNGELSADVDFLDYRFRQNQKVQSEGMGYVETYSGTIPTDYRIFSGKVDYSEKIGLFTVDGGAKISHISTDNEAAYLYNNGMGWKPDDGKSNHFLYTENQQALYADLQTKRGQWSWQGGLRFERTNYSGHQLVKDISFSNNYNSLFPSVFVSFEKDSSNTFSFSAGRRIDRPAFQSLNPAVIITNKYTYQTGNPYFRPQFTWNVGLNHSYKNTLLTGLSYSLTTDYFAQLFKTDAAGIVTFTQGNFGRREIVGASVGLQLAPVKWWSTVLQTQINYKHLQGFINTDTAARITQYTVNWSNQFHFKNGWSAEATGIYNSKSQVDIQEILDPSGQVLLGIAKSLAQNKYTIKLSVRDVFYTAWYKGNSTFTQAHEYFKLTRDSRVAALSLVWHFGKVYKAAKRPEGATDDELQRLGND